MAYIISIIHFNVTILLKYDTNIPDIYKLIRIGFY